MANRNTNLTKPELVKPTINGDTDVWGRKLNDNIDKQDVFNAKLIEDSESQNTELERLEKEKFDINDVEEIVYPMMDNYADTHIKPKLDEHVETVNKPNLDAYTESKKQELNKHVQDVNKVELNTYTETKKSELDTHTTEKKSELDSYTSTKKSELDTHTIEKESRLDLYEKEKEKELDTFTTAKKSEITQHTNTEKENITSHTEDKKLELDTYTNGKKEQLDNYTNEKQTQLDNYTVTKQEQLDGYTTTKKEEITEHTETKKTEITSHTDSKKTELDEYEKVKESQLNTYTTIKEQQITEHTDSEIERIKATGIDGKLDKGGYEGTAQDLKNEIDNKPNTEVIAGNGILANKSGNEVTISLQSATDGIVINKDNIQLNVVNDLLTGGITRPLSAEQGKVLKQLIDTIGQGGTTTLLRKARIIGENDYLGNLTANTVQIVVGNKLNEPTLYLDGIRMDKNTYSVELNTGLITLNQVYANYDVTWVVTDKLPYHIRFSYPTLQLLQNDENIKSIIELGDVIEIQGESDANDGGHRLVICENTSKLNGVDIGNGRFLNEIPNSRPEMKQDKTDNKLQTTSKEIVGAINESLYRVNWLKIKDLEYPDLLQLRKPGFYEFSSKTMVGRPDNVENGFLIIPAIDYNGSGSGRVQIAIERTGQGRIFTRTIYDDIAQEWQEVLFCNSKLFLGNAGITAIKYIQENAIKEANKGYIDKTTGELYYCYKRTPENVVTPDRNYFYKATNIDNTKSIQIFTHLKNNNGFFIRVSLADNKIDFPNYYNTLRIPVGYTNPSNNTRWMYLNGELTIVSGYNYGNYSGIIKGLISQYKIKNKDNDNFTINSNIMNFMSAKSNPKSIFVETVYVKEDNEWYLDISHKGKQTTLDIHYVDYSDGLPSYLIPKCEGFKLIDKDLTEVSPLY